MALSQQEQQILLQAKLQGKTPEQAKQAILNYRLGYKPQPVAEKKNSTGKDLAIGAVKGLGESVRSTQDVIAGSIPNLLGPAAAIPHVRKAVQGVVEPAKNAMQGALGLTDDNLAADNTTQQVGKYGEIAAQFVTPFVATRLAGLISKGASLAKTAPAAVQKSGIGGMVQRGIEKTKEFVSNPRLALAKVNAEPQLETSANRMFLKGTGERIDDPIAWYEKDLAHSKKAVTDIKADPAIANVGGEIGDQFKGVVAKRRTVGKTMQDELKKVGGLKTDILPATDNFVADLADEGVAYDRVSKQIIQRGKQTKLTSDDAAMLEKYAQELQRLGSKPTIAELDAFMSRLPKELDVYKSSKNITGNTNADRIVKKSLSDLRSQFDPKRSGNPQLATYAEARKAYADLSDFIDEGSSYLGKLTQSGDFAKDASLAKSAVQSILNNGKKDFLVKLEELTGYPALDRSVIALQAMKDAGDFRGLSLLETLAEGSAPTSQSGITRQMIDFAFEKASRLVSGTPEEQTRAFLNALKEAAQRGAKQ